MRIAARTGCLIALAACSTTSAAVDDAGAVDATVADASTGDGTNDSGRADAASGLRVTVFSRTNGFRHDSIPAALGMISSQGVARGWSVVETEDPAVLDRKSTRLN